MWLDPDQEQDPNKQPTVSSPSVGAGGGSGGTTVGGKGNPSTVAPVSTQPEQKFASAQDYLKSNQQQGEALGSQVVGNLNQSLQNQKGQIDSAANNAKNQISSGTVNYNPDVVNTAFSNPTAVANGTPITPTATFQVPSGPNGQTRTVTQQTGPSKTYTLNDFLGQYNAAYTGPESFEKSTAYDAAATAANDAKEKAAEVGTTGGRQQIIADQFHNYGQGNKNLDEALLMNSSANPQVQEAGKQFNSVQDYLGAQSQGVNSMAGAAAATTAATKKNAQDLFSNSLTNFQTDINNRVSTDQQAQNATLDKVRQDLASGDATKVKADLDKSNLSPQDKASVVDYLTKLNSIYAVKPDLNNFYSYNPNTDINPATVANKADYDKAAALQKLTGVDYSGVLNPADVSKAGTWDRSQSGFNAPSMQEYLKGALGQQDKELIKDGTQPIADVFTKLNLPNITSGAGAADVKSASQAAQNIIEAAKRQGIGYAPGKSTPIAQLHYQAAKALVNAAPTPAALNSPSVAGLRAFVNALAQFGGYTTY